MGVSMGGHLLVAPSPANPGSMCEARKYRPLSGEADGGPRSPSNLVSRPRLLEIRRQLRAAGKKVVFTNGCFDLLHRGHVEYLREARTLGDVLMVGLNSDSSAAALKGPGRPLMPQQDRAALLCELRSVSYVCIFDEPSVAALVAELLPDVLVKGGDYSLAEVVGREVVEEAGGTVRTLSLWTGASSSDLARRLKL